jgi:hypothetical protein
MPRASDKPGIALAAGLVDRRAGAGQQTIDGSLIARQAGKQLRRKADAAEQLGGG